MGQVTRPNSEALKYSELSIQKTDIRRDSESRSNKRLVFGVVSEPDTVDAHGDVLSKQEIARMAYNFEKYVREFHDLHTRRKAATQIIRSWIIEADTWIKGS